jgi:uncharacterized protein DUF4386
MANALLSVRDHSTLAAVFAFNVGALMYYALFYRSRHVPRWLSGWGIAASLLFLIACLLALFTNTPVTGYTLLILPIAVQEMVLAIWLLAKGFSLSPPTLPAASETTTHIVNVPTVGSAPAPMSTGHLTQQGPTAESSSNPGPSASTYARRRAAQPTGLLAKAPIGHPGQRQ